MFPRYLAERVSPSLSFQQVSSQPTFWTYPLVIQRLVVPPGFIV